MFRNRNGCPVFLTVLKHKILVCFFMYFIAYGAAKFVNLNVT